MNGRRPVFWVIPVLVALALLAVPPASVAGQTDRHRSEPRAALDPVLAALFEAAGDEEPVKIWIVLRRDRGLGAGARLEAALSDLERGYDPHALERRRRLRSRPGLFDVDDLPLPEAWLGALRAEGAEILITSRWAHAVSAQVTRSQAEAIRRLPFVEALREVKRWRTGKAIPGGENGSAAEGPDEPGIDEFYGESREQLEQIGVTTLHAMGYTGSGMRIGVLDSGFRKSHVAFNHATYPLTILAEWDFVRGDAETGPELGDSINQHEHGTLILGTLASYWPEILVGSAYEAVYILAKVEDVDSEYPLEEDWFVAGLEFIEANGGDVATSSVVIFDHYTQEQLDGLTSIMTRGVNVATDNGLHVCQGIGNNGHDADPATSTMLPPADAFRVISVGSVDRDGVEAWFTSDGPTGDGRQKPEVLARGVNTRTVSPWSDTATDGRDGASMATPLVCGTSALLLSAHPDWSVDALRAHLFLHGHYYLANGAPDPLFVQGFGIIDAVAADAEDCNRNGIADDADLLGGASGDCNANGLPDECDVAALISPDDAADGLPDECTECSTGPGCPEPVAQLLVRKQGADLLLSWSAAVDAEAYSVRRDETAVAAGSTEVDRAPGLAWSDGNAVNDPPSLAYYVVRGVTAGGVVGP